MVGLWPSGKSVGSQRSRDVIMPGIALDIPLEHSQKRKGANQLEDHKKVSIFSNCKAPKQKRNDPSTYFSKSKRKGVSQLK